MFDLYSYKSTKKARNHLPQRFVRQGLRIRKVFSKVSMSKELAEVLQSLLLVISEEAIHYALRATASSGGRLTCPTRPTCPIRYPRASSGGPYQ